MALIYRHRARLRALGAPCHLCGLPIDYSLKSPDPMSFVADHVKPRAKGGSDGYANQAAAHKVCNEKKGARDYAPDIIRRSGALQ